jgi:hypothetical protein
MPFLLSVVAPRPLGQPPRPGLGFIEPDPIDRTGKGFRMINSWVLK